MKDHTRQLVENMKTGKDVADALRRVTPGEGRYAGVTEEDVDQLVATYVDLSVRHAEMLDQGRTVNRGPLKTAAGLALRSSFTAALFALGRRRGPVAAAVLIFTWGAAHEATKGYLGTR